MFQNITEIIKILKTARPVACNKLPLKTMKRNPVVTEASKKYLKLEFDNRSILVK